MLKPLIIVLALAFMACKQKKQPAAGTAKTDTIIPAMDTAIGPPPYTEADRLHDSLLRKHELDSFNAIKPQAVFIADKNADAFDKLIAAAIDTNGVTITPIAFTDTTITTYDKADNPVSKRYIYKNKRFTVEVFDRNVNEFAPKKISINGRELRAGIELGTSVHYDEFFYHFALASDACAIIKFGAKEYLFLVGYISNCNGSACGVSFYILYDPVIRKAMLLPQFRSGFITGYDKKNNTPVFIDFGTHDDYNYLCQCFMSSGKVYRLDRRCKTKPVTDKAGKQLHFTAYYTDKSIDTIKLIAGNLPVHN